MKRKLSKVISIMIGNCVLAVSLLSASYATYAISSNDYTQLSVAVDADVFYYHSDNDTWITVNGTALSDQTADMQTALYKGNLYQVDLTQMKVFSENGVMNEELTELLPRYLSFRPIFISGYNGVSIDEVIANDKSGAVVEKLQKIADALPLTYVFSDTVDDFSCSIYLGDTVLGGAWYGIDANDYPEMVPWQKDSNGISISDSVSEFTETTTTTTIHATTASETTTSTTERALDYMQLSVAVDADVFYYHSDNDTWITVNGTALSDQTADMQTALYKGNLYQVDLTQMKVFSENGVMNEELTELLPRYLSFRPIFISGYNGVSIDEVIANDKSGAVAEKLQKIADALPLTYVFSDTVDDFCCSIYLGDTVLGGAWYGIDANDYPEMVPWQKDSNGISISDSVSEFTETTTTTTIHATTASETTDITATTIEGLVNYTSSTSTEVTTSASDSKTETTTILPPENTTTTTADSTLPQTGNNSPVYLLIVCNALLLTGTGAWAIIAAWRRKEE